MGARQAHEVHHDLTATGRRRTHWLILLLYGTRDEAYNSGGTIVVETLARHRRRQRENISAAAAVG